MPHHLPLPLLQYWRNTLADAARVEISVAKTLHLYDVHIDWQNGNVPISKALDLIELAEKQLNKGKGRQDQEDEEWEYLDEVQVLLAPFRVSPMPEYAKFSGETGIFYPFWIRAILNKDGILKPDEDTFPYIPRAYLEPQVNQNINFTFSDVDKVDQSFSQPFAGNDNWRNYWDYLKKTFRTITAMELEQYTPAEFTVTWEDTIVINETITTAADGIIQLYDYLIQKEEVPALLKNLCNKEYEPLKAMLNTDESERASASHVGQMGYEFPLSVSQRKSLYHFDHLPAGNILAVNGPPGTGKTTLLQSIVANEVVKSAIRGGDPAIILACSTNNQAVTNIIDSFSHVKQQQGVLYERWLPDLNSFALYLPSESKVVNDKVLHFKRRKGGFHKEAQNRHYIARAEKLFTDKFREYTGMQGLGVQEIISRLQNTLKEKQQQLQEGIQIWQQYKTITDVITKLAPESSISLLQQQELQEEKLLEIEVSLKTLEGKVSDYLDKEPFWMKIFSFMKFVKEKRATRLKQLFRDCPVDYSSINFYKINSFHLFFDEKLQFIKQIKVLHAAWNTWKNKQQIKGSPPQSDADIREHEHTGQGYFYDELEKGMKYDLFNLAIHYWEGRWILDTTKIIDDDELQRNGLEYAQKKWQRFAMLTPCFVSTFYMAPQFFTYSKFVKKIFGGNPFEAPPILNFIDLLIVDEAGQVSPEIGAATFSLAKKSVVVGDTRQIEPVWNVPAKVDYANLLRYKIIPAITDTRTIGDLMDKGFLSSSGSMMKLAQKSSSFHSHPDMERGMLLTEHRRCFDEIIGYCNKLAYNGLLEPKKGPASGTLLPPMQFIPVTGTSKNIGTSRGNQEEAQQILDWLTNHQMAIINHYQQKENEEAIKDKRPTKKIRLGDLVGIITPFTGQKYMLQSLLRKSSLDTNGLTIGTVHALQGAERAVILFSSTYGINDSGKSYFYDMGVNMLNVAVSRAKESFISFGSKENFDRQGKAPSAQLYRHIDQLKAHR